MYSCLWISEANVACPDSIHTQFVLTVCGTLAKWDEPVILQENQTRDGSVASVDQQNFCRQRVKGNEVSPLGPHPYGLRACYHCSDMWLTQWGTGNIKNSTGERKDRGGILTPAHFIWTNYYVYYIPKQNMCLSTQVQDKWLPNHPTPPSCPSICVFHLGYP